jgi:hypothetical protein
MAEIHVDAFLADSVATADGKLFVQGGGWNRLTASLFPAVHDRIAIGLLVRFDGGDGTHRFELRMLGPAGQELKLGDSEQGPIHRIGGEIRAVSDDDQLVPIAINLNGLTLSTPGDYRFVISVDGGDVKSLPFKVQSLASQSQAQATPGTGTAGYL